MAKKVTKKPVAKKTVKKAMAKKIGLGRGGPPCKK